KLRLDQNHDRTGPFAPALGLVGSCPGHWVLTRHSGAARSAAPGIHNHEKRGHGKSLSEHLKTGDMDSGLAAPRRPGMTEMSAFSAAARMLYGARRTAVSRIHWWRCPRRGQ